MKKVMNVTDVENMNTATTTPAATETAAYVKPAIEVIEMEMEGAILGGSSSSTTTTAGNNFGDGGRY